MEKNHLLLFASTALIIFVVFLFSYNSSPDVRIPEEKTSSPASDSYATITDEKSGISFTYPIKRNYSYVTLSDWPPRFVNSLDEVKCELDEQTSAISGATSYTKTIKGNNYCIWETIEGAAGSVYRAYQITYPKGGQYLTMSFTVQYPQCENFTENEVTVCQTEQTEFDLEALINEVAQSAELP